MNSGIYIIKNKLDGKVYVGQAKNFFSRWRKHLSLLRRGIHGNKHLQRTWNKYEEHNFEFSIIESCSLDCLNEREVFWIKEKNSNNNKIGYNKTIGGEGTTGFKHSKESRIKIGLANKNKIYNKHSVESRIRMSNSAKGRIPWIAGKKHSDKTREKMSLNHANVSSENNPFYGKQHSDETREKIRLSLIGSTPVNKGKSVSQQQKEKMIKNKLEKQVLRVKEKIVENYGSITTKAITEIINNKAFFKGISCQPVRQKEILERMRVELEQCHQNTSS